MFYTKDKSEKMSSLLIFCDKHKTHGSNQKNHSFSEKKQFISLTKNEPFKIVNDDDKKTMKELTLEELDEDIVCDLSLICNDSDVKGLGSVLFDNLVKEMKNRYEKRWEENKERNVAKIIAGQALPVLNDELKEKTKNNDNPFYKPWKRLLDQDKEKELYFYYPTNQKEENEKEKDEDIVERVMIFEIPLFEEKS
jgi:hypothetical protein